MQARLTDGSEIYSHRPDLKSLPFWKCDICGNYVGCHHKSGNRYTPLGTIPTAQLRQVRRKIHEVLDPMWKTGVFDRGEMYSLLSRDLGYQYHTAEIVTMAEAEKVIALLEGYKQETETVEQSEPAGPE